MTDERSSDKGPSVWQLLVDVITRPVPAFTAIARSQGVKWLLPAVLVIATTLVALFAQVPYLAEEALKQLQFQLAAMPPEQAEIVRAQAERFVSPAALMISGGLSSVVVLGLMWLLMSGVLYFLVLLAGGEATFGVAWAMTPWITLPFAVRNLVQAAWVYTQRGLLHYPGLTFLVATGDTVADTRNPLFPVLAQTDPFGLWYVVLVYAALRGGFNMSRRAAVILTVVYVAIMLGVSTLPVFVTRMFS